MLAGAAGVAVVGAVAAPPASASEPPYLVLGEENGWSTTTVLQGGGPDGVPEPAFRLGNENGPSLSLQPLSTSWNGTLQVGDIVNTTEGPLIGVDYGHGAVTDALITRQSLAELPVTVPISPFRLLDTRKPDQTTIVSTSTDGLDAQGRLKGGSWLDVGFVEQNPQFTLVALFLNITVPRPTANGHLVAYPSGETAPGASTLSYHTGQSTSNAAFVAVGVVNAVFAVRILVSKTTHLVVDITGATLTPTPSTPEPLAPGRRISHHPSQVSAVEAVRRAFS